MQKTTSTSVDIRALLLIMISFTCASIFLLEPASPPQVPTPSTSVTDAVKTLREKHQLVHDRLLSDIPACASGRARTFLMVFMGHSGSTAIMTSLQQHSQTYIPGFEPVDHGIYRNGPRSQNSLLALNYTKTFFSNATKLGLTAGFKVRPPNIVARSAQFAQLVRQFGTRIIWNYRSNVFKQAISDYNIHYYGDKAGHEGLKVENGTLEDSTIRNTTIHIANMDALHKFLKSRIRGEKEVEDALRAIRPDGCVLPVSYESYLQHPIITLKRVQVFLGIDRDELHPSLRVKANNDVICDFVENWDQVCESFFRCVQWRWMLDDFENGCSCTSLSPSRFRSSKKYCTLT